MKSSEYTEQISTLNNDEKLYFYETFSHSLTISIREMWSNTKTTESEIIKKIKFINEILHRSTSKIKVERLKLHDWPENEFIKMISHYVKLCPSIASSVAHAIEYSYESTIDKQKS